MTFGSREVLPLTKSAIDKMPYWIHSKMNGSAVSIVVETAKDALAKLAELTEHVHTEVVARDLSGAVVEPSTLQAEADQAP